LFWALWGPSFGRESITKDQLESTRGLAKVIHEKRLLGIYVDGSAENAVQPKDQITREEAEKLLGLATARLGLEELTTIKTELTDAEKENMGWFLDASMDPEKRNLIFGPRSMEKMAELGSAPAWMAWLRQQFEQAEAEGHEMTAQELKRQEPGTEEAKKDKWKVKVRIYSGSHSIKPKPLTWWNGLGSWLKLHPVGNQKNQLIMEFVLPMSVPAQGVWWVAWATARRYFVALNIGTCGYFWWYLPEQIDKFYESLKDIETNSEVRITRSPALRLDWKGGALSEQHLRNSAIVLGMLPGANEKEKHRPFDHYLTALGFLSKTDVHIQFEMNAFEQFYRALSLAMRLYGDWPEKELFDVTFRRLATDFKMEEAEVNRLIGFFKGFDVAPPTATGITLSEVGEIKVLCDAYLLRTFNRMAIERKNSETAPAKEKPAQCSRKPDERVQ
jgi:hypothetical protein